MGRGDDAAGADGVGGRGLDCTQKPSRLLTPDARLHIRRSRVGFDIYLHPTRLIDFVFLRYMQ